MSNRLNLEFIHDIDTDNPKNTILSHMLFKYPDTMFINNDIIIIEKILIDPSKQIGTLKGSELYNYTWISNISFIDSWILEEFDYFYFDHNHSVEDNIDISDNTISIKSNSSKHFHIKIKEHLIKSKKTVPLICIDRIEQNGKWIIKMPKQPCKYGFYRHANDSFRELCYLLGEKHNDIEIYEYHGKHVWLSLQQNILLYDKDKLEHIQSNDPEILQTSLILMGNGNKEIEINTLLKFNIPTKPFIFWSRHPKILENFIQNNSPKSYVDRKYNTIFIGNIENSTQERNRGDKRNWGDVVDIFSCVNGTKHKYTQHEYLSLMANSRFGLSFAGYGRKCNRDVELMALGTVMLRAPELDVDSYYEPLVEGVHYITFNEKEDILKIVNSVSKERWKIMSKQCIDWYMRNCHSDNTFDVWMNSV